MKVRLMHIAHAVRSALRPRVEGIHSEEVFKAMLRHERAVAERNSHFIAVLAFHPVDDRMVSKTVQILGQVLADRLRETDVAGWLDGRTIGVMLPHTQVKNAALVAEQICHRVAARGVRLDYQFYLYPHDECGKMSGQRELPFPKNFDRSAAAVAGHELSRFYEGRRPADADQSRAGLVRAGVHPFGDICASPLPIWKRGLDILLCLVGLLLVGPLMLLIAVGIKIVSPGPVLFRQERIGFRGQPFMLFKFRSMKLNADTNVHQQHLAHLMQSNASMTKLDKADARLIPFGRVFRASGLDELPQLFNILRGDMSLIGPRPCVPYEYKEFSHWHRRRCDMHPGLTGLWQVSGKNKTTFTEMMRLDITYGRRPTLTKDLRILVQTIPAVLRQIREMSTAKR